MSALNRPFKLIETIADFNSAKVSNSEDNTSYIQNGIIVSGEPDILWDNVVFISETAQIWTKGQLYSATSGNERSIRINSNSFMQWDKAVVTLVDISSTDSLVTKVQALEDYPGIIPSIAINQNSSISNNSLLVLGHRGCDVLINATSMPLSMKAAQDMVYNVRKWMGKHGLGSFGIYFNGTLSSDQKNWISLLDEYAINGTLNETNDRGTDNMSLSSTMVSSASQADDAIAQAILDNSLLILTIDSSTMSAETINGIADSIQDFIDSGDVIYLQLPEALKTFCPKFNIGRNSTLPFRVYSDGTVDANLSDASINTFKNNVGVKADWNEDDPESLSYIDNKPDIDIPDLSYFPLLGDDVDVAYVPVTEEVSFLSKDAVDSVDVDF